jgi:protein-tyrosine-phosphatase
MDFDPTRLLDVRRIGIALVATWLVVTVSSTAASQAALTSRSDKVVFVCQHGNVKSLIAASLFNREAVKRGLPYRAESRGVTPERAVPPKIAAPLRADGFDISGFKPAKILESDVGAAVRVVGISIELSSIPNATHRHIDSWEDVPAATVDYAAAKASLLVHIDALLKELRSNYHGS